MFVSYVIISQDCPYLSKNVVICLSDNSKEMIIDSLLTKAGKCP